MLQKREDDLRRRREHVEKLLRWHQRLDDEEHEVREMERLLMMFSATDTYNSSRLTSNENLDVIQQKMRARAIKMAPNQHPESFDRDIENAPAPINRASLAQKQQKHIRDIEESLRTLQNISARSITPQSDGSSLIEESVQVGGKQLNRLWKRLTGRTEEKFTPSKVYVLSKQHLENIYEEAKEAVLKRFDAGLGWNKIMDTSSIVGDGENKSVDTFDKEIISDLENGSSGQPLELLDSRRTELQRSASDPGKQNFDFYCLSAQKLKFFNSARKKRLSSLNYQIYEYVISVFSIQAQCITCKRILLNWYHL